jgi:replicative DNA helicase
MDRNKFFNIEAEMEVLDITVVALSQLSRAAEARGGC